MNCLIIDDEPLARDAMQRLINKVKDLKLVGSFSNTTLAAELFSADEVDLVFLDIEMPGINGLEFAKTIPSKTLIIFTTAFAEYALDSYEVEAVDYLIKPINLIRFQKAVTKAMTYHQLLKTGPLNNNNIETVTDDYFFVKADRKVFKIQFRDILFIEGLKDYVVLQTEEQKIITAINIKTIYDQLPRHIFVRVSKSYIININQIVSFDNNTIIIGKYEIPIGNAYRSCFFDDFVAKKLIGRKN